MKAIKKPIPIEVEEFQPSKKPWPTGVNEDRSGLAGVEYFIWNARHGSRINLEPGDYVNVTTPEDIYPIKKDIFHATYTIITK